VEVGLRALNVVVQVVTELHNHIDGLIAGSLGEVTVEEGESNEAISVEVTDTAKLGGGILLREVNGGGATDALTELLQ
jgi:hypothetical protein